MAPALRHPAVLLVLLAAAPVGAATFVVDRYDDSASADGCILGVANDCSLRGAILKANSTAGDDTVKLAAGDYHMTITGAGEDLGLTGDFDLLDDVTVRGAGAGITVVWAHAIDRVFDVRPGVVAFFQRLTMTMGHETGGAGGGGIRDNGQVTIVQRCEIDSNQTNGYGGGILSMGGGGLWLQETLVTNNRSDGPGGGIFQGPGTAETIESSVVAENWSQFHTGGVALSGVTAVIRNSTISRNRDQTAHIDGISTTDTTLTLDACTLAEMSNVDGKALSVFESTVTLRNSLLVGPCLVQTGGTIVSEGGNLESDGATCNLGAADLENVENPRIDPLARYGGATLTNRLQSLSPAVDFAPADANCQPVDQRGISRPQAAGTPGPAHCDIGAYERVNRELFLDGFEGGTWWGWSGWSD